MAERSASDAHAEGFDLDVDVLAAGSGLGSLTAAIVAHDLGKRVAVFEKAPRMGGLCGYGGGEVFCPNGPHMTEIGERDSDAAARRYVDFLAAGYNDPALTDVLMRHYREAIAYLEKEAGVRWIPIKGLPVASGWNVQRMVIQALVHGCFGLGVGILVQAFAARAAKA
jgi:predicted oxidoreductase